MTARNESIAPVVVLKAPRLNRQLIMYARAVYSALLDNPSFPSPNPPLDVFAVHITELEDAETKAATRAKGAAAHRNAKKKVVKEDLFHLCDYVLSVVEKNTSPAVATDLIQSANMSVRKVPKRSFPEVSAKNGDVSGKVMLAAKAVAPVAMYYWEYSLDQVTWTPVPETMRARTEVSGLTSGSVYSFRFRAHTRAGRQDASQVVSLLVH